MSPLNAYRLDKASSSERSTEDSDADSDYGDERVGKQLVAPGKILISSLTVECLQIQICVDY